MRRTIAGLLVAGWLGCGTPLYAEWVSLSGGLPEADISFLTSSSKEPYILYAASSKRVYRRESKGDNWKQVLSIRGNEARIHFLLSDSYSPGTLYVASDKGVQKSEDGGKKWNWIYRGVAEKARSVLVLCEDPQDPGSLWLGTAQGLVRAGKDGRQAVKIASFPETAVHSIWIPREKSAFLLASSAAGIFKSADAGGHWEKVFTENKPDAAENDPEALSQFQIEEFHTGPAFSGLIHVPAQNKYLTASSSGIFESDASASSWKKVTASLPSDSIRHLTASSETFYAATDRGVFQWDAAGNHFKDLSDGLPSQEVNAVYYHPFSGDLYAATKRGVHRFPKPELKIQADTDGKPEPGQILGRFSHEPTVLDVQQAAIRYAEVYPEKIEAWRQAAMRKAMLPTLSLSADQGEDHNVDIDRGGTGDADRFITGPSETNTDWHMGVSWDLGDLLWNDDQTSIDTRSKLMVELRGDILNEVTHLYFERRRFQVEMLLNPAKELPLQIEKDLKLQELTADIDALTGGYLSAKLNEGRHVEIG